MTKIHNPMVSLKLHLFTTVSLAVHVVSGYEEMIQNSNGGSPPICPYLLYFILYHSVPGYIWSRNRIENGLAH